MVKQNKHTCPYCGKTPRITNLFNRLPSDFKVHFLYIGDTEFNNKYLDIILKHGMVPSGINPQKKLVEIVEIKEHPWFVACQFHPEFKSKPDRVHPLFCAFTYAAINN